MREMSAHMGSPRHDGGAESLPEVQEPVLEHAQTDSEEETVGSRARHFKTALRGGYFGMTPEQWERSPNRLRNSNIAAGSYSAQSRLDPWLLGSNAAPVSSTAIA